MVSHRISDYWRNHNNIDTTKIKRTLAIAIGSIIVGLFLLLPWIAESLELFIHNQDHDSLLAVYEQNIALAGIDEMSPGSLVTRLFGEDVVVIREIIKCESEWIPDAKNPYSSAKGLMQILDGTWEEFECEGDPLDPIDNINCGKKIYDRDGLRPWESSSECWRTL